MQNAVLDALKKCANDYVIDINIKMTPALPQERKAISMQQSNRQVEDKQSELADDVDMNHNDNEAAEKAVDPDYDINDAETEHDSDNDRTYGKQKSQISFADFSKMTKCYRQNCRRYFENPDDLKRHMSEFHKCNFACTVTGCPMMCLSKHGVLAHIRQAHKSDKPTAGIPKIRSRRVTYHKQQRIPCEIGYGLMLPRSGMKLHVVNCMSKLGIYKTVIEAAKQHNSEKNKPQPDADP